MKLRFITLSCASLLFFTQCTTSTDPLKVDANSSSVSTNDTLQSALFNTLADINHNLELVREKQGLIEHPEGEVKDTKANILENISLINALLDENRRKIEELQSQTKLFVGDKKALKRLLDQAKNSMQVQAEQILKLKQDLAFEEFKVADLNVMMDELQVQNEQLQSEKDNLERLNSQLDLDVNKVYFVYGNETELREKEILNPRAAIKLQKTLLSPHFNRNREFFVEFDLRKLTEIPINGKDAKLLTLHPEDSYKWEQTSKEFGKIVITDPSAFWSISRYLVVLVKN